jgi:hypothetical protein
MDLAGHPAPFPQLKILRPFPVLTVSLHLGLARLVAEEEEPPLPPQGEESKLEEHHNPPPPQPRRLSLCLPPHRQPTPNPTDAREDRGENTCPP